MREIGSHSSSKTKNDKTGRKRSDFASGFFLCSKEDPEIEAGLDKKTEPHAG